MNINNKDPTIEDLTTICKEYDNWSKDYYEWKNDQEIKTNNLIKSLLEEVIISKNFK